MSTLLVVAVEVAGFFLGSSASHDRRPGPASARGMAQTPLAARPPA